MMTGTQRRDKAANAALPPTVDTQGGCDLPLRLSCRGI
jgi:hypothetical protein